MSAYSYINGIIYCDDLLDGDIELDLSENIYAGVVIRKSPSNDILFSLGIKECRLDYFFNLMEKWKTYKSLEHEEWHPIEVYLTIWYESDNRRVDCLRIRDGRVCHRETYD